MKKNLLVAQSGGPTAAINATLAGVIKQAIKEEQIDQVYGACYGIQGVLEQKFVNLTEKVDTEEKLEEVKENSGGSVLVLVRFKLNDIKEDDSQYQEIVDILHKMNIGYFVYIGGNDSMDTVAKLSAYCKEKGVEDIKVIGGPKTIDNDVWGTEMTFGFQSAVDIATEVIDCIHTTATSHGRIFIVEVMGHKVGWLNLYAGIAGGADIILIPEIPYDIDSVVKTIKSRTAGGKNFSILAVAEGAISKKIAALPKKQRKAAIAEMKYPSISYQIAHDIEEATGQETRVTVPGHFQRGGSPDAYDRVISTRFGVKAAELIINKDYGKMVALVNNKVVAVPLEDTRQASLRRAFRKTARLLKQQEKWASALANDFHLLVDICLCCDKMNMKFRFHERECYCER